MEKDVDDSVKASVAGGAWLFLSSLVISLTGFIFWLIVARITGVSTVGVAGSIVSGAGMAATLTSAGLGPAVVREVAARGAPAVRASLIAALLLGLLAAFAAYALTGILGYGHSLYALVLAFLSVLSMTTTMALIGLESFRGYFASTLLGSSAKLVVGTVLSLLGWGTMAALLGYLSVPLVASTAALAMLAPLLVGAPRGDLGLGSILSLAASNYPFMLSAQLTVMLSVYAYALLSREALSTGLLYIALMASLAVSALPLSIVNASLPIATRRGSDPFAEGARLGLAVATPLIAALAAAPSTVLRLMNPELAGGGWVLALLLLSITPMTVVTTAITRLNRDAKRGEILAMGALRLLVLLVLLPIGAEYYGAAGAALAYLAGNVAPLPLAFKYVPGLARPALASWAIQSVPVAFLALGVEGVLPAVVFFLASLPLVQLSGTADISEILYTLRHAARSLLG